MTLPIPEAIFTIALALYVVGVLAWSHEEYWSVYDPRARFLPGTGMLHSFFYTRDKKPKFKRGVKSEPSITPGN